MAESNEMFGSFYELNTRSNEPSLVSEFFIVSFLFKQLTSSSSTVALECSLSDDAMVRYPLHTLVCQGDD